MPTGFSIEFLAVKNIKFAYYLESTQVSYAQEQK